jgi:hypothetical protein
VKELQTAVTIVKGGQKMFFFSVARKNAKRRQKHFLESSKNIKVKIFDICICISENVLLIFLNKLQTDILLCRTKFIDVKATRKS